MNAGMRPLSLYLDMSVIGGYHDPEFMADTRRLWQLQAAGQFRFYASDVVIEESLGAPPRVRELFDATFGSENLIAVTPEAEQLAAHYMKAKVVPAKYVDDARHVAVCTVAGIGHLVSWNFKHLTNLHREAGFNAVNLLQGYPPVRIVAPSFLVHGDEEKSP